MKDWRFGASLKALVLGRARDLSDQRLFHHVSLAAVLAWVGLGADGLSSSCYGPEEIYRVLGKHTILAVFVGIAAVVTIAVLCASYRQIIQRFPSGGGGYLVASKLLSPAAGVISGSALLIDYVLTIAISVASASEALFSTLPFAWHAWRLPVALGGVLVLTLINLRGVRETVRLWAPVFFLFLGTHAVALGFALAAPPQGWNVVAATASEQLSQAHAELGLWGMLVLVVRAYSLGAGTYTGIEAVSNGMPILREPRVDTARRTMIYVGFSLGATVLLLLVAYQVYGVSFQPGQTLNSVLLRTITASWPEQVRQTFVTVAMLSATALLFIAAQAGFLDGPRVLATMALDRWFPSRFATLSDRFVTQNGILLMGLAGFLVVLASRGSVAFLVILYSVNVFITFSFSQLGMVRDGWRRRSQEGGRRQLMISGIGLALTTSILFTLVAVKFHEGAWITIVVTSAVVLLAVLIQRHYRAVAAQLQRLNVLVEVGADALPKLGIPAVNDRTAVVLVNGYNGLGLHTLLSIAKLFPQSFARFVFVEVGVVDAGTFKGAEELENLRQQAQSHVHRYAELARKSGFSAEGVIALSHDVVQAVEEIGDRLLQQYPHAVFFSGQLAFQRETRFTRWLHNYVVFALQRVFCRKGVPFVIVPVRV
jgi:amino acid transporter